MWLKSVQHQFRMSNLVSCIHSGDSQVVFILVMFILGIASCSFWDKTSWFVLGMSPVVFILDESSCVHSGPVVFVLGMSPVVLCGPVVFILVVCSHYLLVHWYARSRCFENFQQLVAVAPVLLRVVLQAKLEVFHGKSTGEQHER